MFNRVRSGLIAALVTVGLSAVPAHAAVQGAPDLDPSDAQLVPSPVETSDPGTAWACRLAGDEVQCTGALAIAWQEQDGPGDWCSLPLYSVNGTFTRTQTRYYAYDAATGQYLEYKRLIHLYSNEYLTPVPELSSNVVIARSNMTWQTAFHRPGDLDSRITRKQGIDTLIRRPAGGIIVLDVGQKTEDLTIAPGEDFNFHGRWDIALGDPAVEFGKICSALGL